MFGFLLKKNLCDIWDNLLSVIIANVIFILSVLGIIFVSAFITKIVPENMNQNLFFLIQGCVFLVGCIILSIIAFAYGEQAAKVADFDGIRIVDFFLEIPGVLKDAVLFGCLITFVVFVSAYSLEFYLLQQQSLFGLFIGSLLFWVDLFIFLALQWFVPIRSSMHNNFMKCLKKCFIVFFDNTGFTLLVTLNNIFLIALTVLFIGFMPSIGGVLIANANALRLRLYKYDYLEAHPELKSKKERRQIPWEELIYEDRETLGPRKLKSFLFPWKE
ncbi:MAG: hypothetical protein MJ188_06105 [Treponema sp.]|nr:hypothetical protein [Treponema sp.]